MKDAIESMARLLWEARDKFCVEEMGHNPWAWSEVVKDQWLHAKYRAMAKAALKACVR